MKKSKATKYLLMLLAVNNMGASDTGVLEDDLQLMQDFRSKNAKVDDPIKMITEELPDPKLLHLYK